jgi:hypothetical protein
MTRIDYYKVAPEGVKAVRALEHYLRASINAWNRLAVTFRPAVGNYKPAIATTAVST